ncbi:MAG: hypothetical protein IJW37_06005 [Lachnospiraceae bacterium]|nr:hypothetical protein [Lachnospiraceae bacterium]
MLRLRRSVKRNIGILLLSVTAGAGLLAAGEFLGKMRARQSYETRLAEQTLRIESAERLAYITTKEVKAGEVFTAENTERRYLLSEQAAEGLAIEVLGKVSCANLKVGTIIQNALCGEAEVSDTERECVFEDIEQAERYSDYAVIDVRIRYPNGENYCVLHKKVLRREEGEETCRLSLTEPEQLLISGARYDAERYNGTTLYAVAFLEERLQAEADSRYIPPAQVILQLQQSAEDVGVAEEWYGLRTALEERLRKNKELREENLY